MELKCECCNFTTTLKTNYTRHLATKKHLKMIEESEIESEIESLESEEDKFDMLIKKNESMEVAIQELKLTIEQLVNSIKKKKK